MILVTGATGNAGGATVEALAAAGQDVRAVSRSEREWPEGVEGLVGDLERPETLTPALAGAEALFLLSGYEGTADLLSVARDAGVERVVLLSSSSAPGGDMDNAVARYHIIAERTVQESGLAWTFLRPNSFMTNALQWAPALREGDLVREPFAHVAVAAIDPVDIGAVAAAALTEAGHEGKAYRLSGPEALRPADRVRILGEVLGRDLSFEGQSDEEAREEMRAGGMPPEYIDAFFSFFSDGDLDESEVLPNVRDLLGRRPRTFGEWAADHAAAFA